MKTGKLRELFRWLPLMLTLLFVYLLVFTHFIYAGFKAKLGPNAFLLINDDTNRALAVWHWVNNHLGFGWAYCALLLAVSYYLSTGRDKIWVTLLLVALLLPALWYYTEAVYLGGKFLRLG